MSVCRIRTHCYFKLHCSWLLNICGYMSFMAFDGVHPHTIFTLDREQEKQVIFSTVLLNFCIKWEPNSTISSYCRQTNLDTTFTHIAKYLPINFGKKNKKKNKLAERLLFVLLLNNPQKMSLLAEKNNNVSGNMWMRLFF